MYFEKILYFSRVVRVAHVGVDGHRPESPLYLCGVEPALPEPGQVRGRDPPRVLVSQGVIEPGYVVLLVGGRRGVAADGEDLVVAKAGEDRDAGENLLLYKNIKKIKSCFTRYGTLP